MSIPVVESNFPSLNAAMCRHKEEGIASVDDLYFYRDVIRLPVKKSKVLVVVFSVLWGSAVFAMLMEVLPTIDMMGKLAILAVTSFIWIGVGHLTEYIVRRSNNPTYLVVDHEQQHKMIEDLRQ